MNTVEITREEMDIEIECILSKGLKTPKSLWQYLREIGRALGFRYVFLEMTLAFIISFVAIMGFFILFPLSRVQYVYAALFALAPAFFIFIVLFTEFLERMNGMYELKMSLKYTLNQVTAFRIMCFALFGILLFTLVSIYFNYLTPAYGFIKCLSISLCALFRCSFETLFMMRRFHWNRMYMTGLLLWIALGLSPVWIFGDQWELFLSNMPSVIVIFIAVTSFVLFLAEIKQMMNPNKRKGEYCAVY